MPKSLKYPFSIKTILHLFFFILIPVNVFAQPGAVKIDTAYFNNRDKKILSITETMGNKKTVTNFNQNGTKSSVEYYTHTKRDGIWLRWYQSGEKQSENIYSNGHLLKSTQWFQSGILEMEQNYKVTKIDTTLKSVLDGKYLHNNASGQPMSLGIYKEGKKNGEWTEYYESGIKKSIINYKDDKKEGKSTFWYRSGKLGHEMNYATEIRKEKLHEVQHGKQTIYFETGLTKEKSNYKMGKKDGLFEEWHENGNKWKEIEYKLDEINGREKYWYKNGKLTQDCYYTLVYDSLKKSKQRIYEGKFETYFENGNLKMLGNYVKGKQIGMFTTYYENGQKINEIFYKEGLPTGKATSWHQNGVPNKVENFIIIKEKEILKSVLDGEYNRYVENNTLVEKGTYKNGNREGAWNYWNKEAIKTEEATYCNGLKCGKNTLWNDDGSLKHEMSWVIETVNGTPISFVDGIEKIYSTKGVLTRINYYNSKHFFYKTEEYYEDGIPKVITYHLTNSQYTHPNFGRHSTFFSNGQLESEAMYYRDRVVGRIIHYFINGNLKSIVDYDGKGRDGRYGYDIQWSSDGELTSFKKYTNRKDFENVNDPQLAKSIYESYMNRPLEKGKLENGVKEGLWVSWFDSAHKQFEQVFKNGKPDENFIAYFPDGKILTEIELKDAVPNGKFISRNYNGNSLTEGNYTNGEGSGTWTTYFDNGNKDEETRYEAGQKNYTYRKQWYENGNPRSEMNYRDGQENGRFAYWYDNGKLTSEGERLNGRNEGLCKEYYANGNQKSEKTFTPKGMEGLETQWYESGKKERTYYYKDNKKQGEFRWWFEKGSLKGLGFYKNDYQDSLWVFYNEDGSIERQNVYVKGILQRAFSGLDCECTDSTSGNKIGFAPLLSGLAKLSEVRKMSLNFHAPIGDFYDNLFYVNLFNSSNGSTSFNSFKIISFQQLYLKIPDQNGIKLILNPCMNTGTVESRTEFEITYDRENKENTRAVLYSKYMSIEFNPYILHQWDKKTATPFASHPPINKNEERPKTKYVPAQVLFKTKSIEYTEHRRLNIDEVKEPCFPTSEIGNSGLLLDFKEMVLDLDATYNPYELESLLPSRYYDYYYDYEGYNPKNKGKTDMFLGKARGNFTGIFVPEATITLPKAMFPSKAKDTLVVKAKNLMISGQYLVGTIHIKATLADGLNYKVESKDENIIFNATDVETFLKSKEFRKVKTEYDPITSEFIIYIFYYAS